MNRIVVSGWVSHLENSATANGTIVERFLLCIPKANNQCIYVNCVAFDKTALNIDKCVRNTDKVVIDGKFDMVDKKKNDVTFKQPQIVVSSFEKMMEGAGYGTTTRDPEVDVATFKPSEFEKELDDLTDDDLPF